MDLPSWLATRTPITPRITSQLPTADGGNDIGLDDIGLDREAPADGPILPPRPGEKGGGGRDAGGEGAGATQAPRQPDGRSPDGHPARPIDLSVDADGFQLR